MAAELYSLWTSAEEPSLFPQSVGRPADLVDAVRLEIEEQLVDPLLAARPGELQSEWKRCALRAIEQTLPHLLEMLSALHLPAQPPPPISAKSIALPLKQLSERCYRLGESTFAAFEVRREFINRVGAVSLDPSAARALAKAFLAARPQSRVDKIVLVEYGADLLALAASLALVHRVENRVPVDARRVEEVLELAQLATRKAFARSYDEVRAVVGAKKADELFGVGDEADRAD